MATILIVEDDPDIPDQREILLEPFVRLEASRNRRTGGAASAWSLSATSSRGMAAASRSAMRRAAVPASPFGCRYFSVVERRFAAGKSHDGSGSVQPGDGADGSAGDSNTEWLAPQFDQELPVQIQESN